MDRNVQQKDALSRGQDEPGWPPQGSRLLEDGRLLYDDGRLLNAADTSLAQRLHTQPELTKELEQQSAVVDRWRLSTPLIVPHPALRDATPADDSPGNTILVPATGDSILRRAGEIRRSWTPVLRKAPDCPACAQKWRSPDKAATVRHTVRARPPSHRPHALSEPAPIVSAVPGARRRRTSCLPKRWPGRCTTSGNGLRSGQAAGRVGVVRDPVPGPAIQALQGAAD